MTVGPEYEHEDVSDGGSYEPEVAHLLFQHTAQPVVQQLYAIFANDQFNIGRVLVQKCLKIEDRCVSKHHLKIHCVQYADDENKVAPMVWARVLSNNAVVFNRKGLDDDEDGGIRIDKDYGDFLLSHGDFVQITSKIRIVFTVPNGDRPEPTSMDVGQIAELQTFAHLYRLSQRVLGFGAYATVYVASDEKTGKQLACKVVKQARPRHEEDNRLRPSNKKDTEVVAREFNVLKKLSHPNIIALQEVICTPYNVYIFQDLITGGDLMSHVDKTGPLKEPQAAVIVRQLLEAVQYLHANQIAHRDIKPENILMTSWRDGGRIVLTDFGQATMSESVATKTGAFRMQTIVGTPGYLAPEMSRKSRQARTDTTGYSQAVDLWSVGCVTCMLLSADILFQGERDISNGLSKEEYDHCMEKINFGRNWLHIHRRAKDFIKGCLELDERDRLTATEALASRWFTHPHYRAEMDAAYARAIADWKPKDYDEDKLIWHIDTKSIVEQAESEAEGETIRSQYFDTQVNASPVAPNTSPGLRRESDDLSTFLPDPPQYEDDDYGDDPFQHLSLEDNENAQQQYISDTFSTCPAPPQYSPRKKVCR